MEHNQQLIQIINQLNQKEARQKPNAARLQTKTNSVKNIVEELPESSDVLKSYLKKFKNFKSQLNESNTKVEDTEELDELLDTVAAESEADFERYSKKDSRVFRNKAKRSETKVTNMRWKQYSNSKANLTNDSKMAPLRLDKYSS